MSGCPWNCDDDGRWLDDATDVWEALEECAGPEYLMWRDKMDDEAETPTWRPPAKQTYVFQKDWTSRLC